MTYWRNSRPPFVTQYERDLRAARRMDRLITIIGWAVAGGIAAVFWWAVAVMW